MRECLYQPHECLDFRYFLFVSDLQFYFIINENNFSSFFFFIFSFRLCFFFLFVFSLSLLTFFFVRFPRENTSIHSRELWKYNTILSLNDNFFHAHISSTPMQCKNWMIKNKLPEHNHTVTEKKPGKNGIHYKST